MCKDPQTLPDGTVVACRNCELCRYNRVKDWAGRNIAQAKVSKASFACTLTYGPELDGDRMPIAGKSDHMRMSVLTYSDVQNFLKYLRWLGYPCDYLVTGELGSLNSRTHWHIILHFRDRVPSHELRVNFSDRHPNQFGKLYDHEVCKAWPHGFMYWIPAKFEDVFYNCKYLLKAENDEAAQRKPGMSKKPPIGAEYFLRLADVHVRQHLAPQSLEYRFDEVKKKDGTPLIFYLKGRTAEMYLDRFIARWKEVHGDKPRPKSQLVDLYEEYGKIVTDEARMLLREEFPRGESRLVFPTGERIKAVAEEVRAERETVMRELAEMDKENWQNRWVKDGDDEQERQRRETVVWRERNEGVQRRDAEWQEYCEYKAKYGWQFIPGKGWVCDRPRPDKAGAESFTVWLSKVRPPRPEEPDVGTLGRGGSPGDPLGPVGTFNARYGKGRSGDGCEDAGADA